jgi:hypothetical protein
MSERWPFELRVAGQLVVGVIESVTPLAAAPLRGAARRNAPAPAEAQEPRTPGRPSSQARIAAAVAALGKRLDRRQSLAQQARVVLNHMAMTCDDPALVPQRTTVEIFLRKRTRAKSRANSRRAISPSRR